MSKLGFSTDSSVHYI